MHLLSQPDHGNKAAIALHQVIGEIADQADPKYGTDDLAGAAAQFGNDSHGDSKESYFELPSQ